MAYNFSQGFGGYGGYGATSYGATSFGGYSTFGGAGSFGGAGNFAGAGNFGGIGGTVLSGYNTGATSLPAYSGFGAAQTAYSPYSGLYGGAATTSFNTAGVVSAPQYGSTYFGQQGGFTQQGFAQQGGFSQQTYGQPQAFSQNAFSGFNNAGFKPEIKPPKVNPTAAATSPERVERLLEAAFSKMEALGNQIRNAAVEFDELRTEVVSANNICDSELRTQLQEANDEIVRLREQLQECAARKAAARAAMMPQQQFVQQDPLVVVEDAIVVEGDEELEPIVEVQ